MALREERYLEEGDPLVAGLTRPAMYAGVTQSFFIINLWACVMLFVGRVHSSGSWLLFRYCTPSAIWFA